jgi:hypothetical protein
VGKSLKQKRKKDKEKEKDKEKGKKKETAAVARESDKEDKPAKEEEVWMVIPIDDKWAISDLEEEMVQEDKLTDQSPDFVLQTFLITNYFYYQSYLLSLTQGPTIFTCYHLSLTDVILAIRLIYTAQIRQHYKYLHIFTCNFS